MVDVQHLVLLLLFSFFTTWNAHSNVVDLECARVAKLVAAAAAALTLSH